MSSSKTGEGDATARLAVGSAEAPRPRPSSEDERDEEQRCDGSGTCGQSWPLCSRQRDADDEPRGRLVDEGRVEPSASHLFLASTSVAGRARLGAEHRARDDLPALLDEADEVAADGLDSGAATRERLGVASVFSDERLRLEFIESTFGAHASGGAVNERSLEARYPSENRDGYARGVASNAAPLPRSREDDAGAGHRGEVGRPRFDWPYAVPDDLDLDDVALELHAEAMESKDAIACASSARIASSPARRDLISRYVGSVDSNGSTPSERSFRLAPAIVYRWP